MTPYLEKTICENRDESEGQVTYREGMRINRSTPLSPKN